MRHAPALSRVVPWMAALVACIGKSKMLKTREEVEEAVGNLE